MIFMSKRKFEEQVARRVTDELERRDRERYQYERYHELDQRINQVSARVAHLEGKNDPRPVMENKETACCAPRGY